ncbi:helix-turn-helix domain-containing protein [Virgibacillus sp. W0430]|uniref:helix-turn-helix domain-containing protein n=1 Tax=Virgibacillus sp. W0430 TaxID=3391580 RepID=UPI003F47C975
MKNDLIRDIRMYKGLTQERFAEWLGVHYSTIANVEANYRPVSEGLASKIALKFDVTDADFMEYRERRNHTNNYFFNVSI